MKRNIEILGKDDTGQVHLEIFWRGGRLPWRLYGKTRGVEDFATSELALAWAKKLNPKLTWTEVTVKL